MRRNPGLVLVLAFGLVLAAAPPTQADPLSESQIRAIAALIRIQGPGGPAIGLNAIPGRFGAVDLAGMQTANRNLAYYQQWAKHADQFIADLRRVNLTPLQMRALEYQLQLKTPIVIGGGLQPRGTPNRGIQLGEQWTDRNPATAFHEMGHNWEGSPGHPLQPYLDQMESASVETRRLFTIAREFRANEVEAGSAFVGLTRGRYAGPFAQMVRQEGWSSPAFDALSPDEWRWKVEMRMRARLKLGGGAGAGGEGLAAGKYASGGSGLASAGGKTILTWAVANVIEDELEAHPDSPANQFLEAAGPYAQGAYDFADMASDFTLKPTVNMVSEVGASASRGASNIATVILSPDHMNSPMFRRRYGPQSEGAQMWQAPAWYEMPASTWPRTAWTTAFGIKPMVARWYDTSE